MSIPNGPKVVELPGLNNPVYSIQENGDWWRDKSDKRRAWSSLRAAERAMGLTVATRNMKKARQVPKSIPKSIPKSTSTLAQQITDYAKANPDATAGECAQALGIPVERIFEGRT